MQSGCYFFRKKGVGDPAEESAAQVLGKSLGSKAKGPDYEALENIYGIAAAQPAAAIRPDPRYICKTILRRISI